MRSGLAPLVFLLLLAPAAPAETGDEAAASDEAPAAQSEERRERVRSCQTLRKQIAHFEEVAERARERDDEVWEQGTERHVASLEARAERVCPPDDDDGAFAALGRLARGAARTAVRLFSAGAL